jgi:hypothetical protein
LRQFQRKGIRTVGEIFSADPGKVKTLIHDDQLADLLGLNYVSDDIQGLPDPIYVEYMGRYRTIDPYYIEDELVAWQAHLIEHRPYTVTAAPFIGAGFPTIRPEPSGAGARRTNAFGNPTGPVVNPNVNPKGLDQVCV